jgi:hypothetical protein
LAFGALRNASRLRINGQLARSKNKITGSRPWM